MRLSGHRADCTPARRSAQAVAIAVLLNWVILPPVDLQTIINSRLGVGFTLAVGRVTPPGIGYRLADLLARTLASLRRATIVRVVRANQWVVSQGQLSAEELDQAVRETFCHTGHCLYDLYHNLGNLPAMQRLVEFGPRVEEFLARCRDEKRGLVIGGPHLSNFDFAGQAVAMWGLRFQALSYPQPGSGYRLQNDLRRKAGIDITPASMIAVRQAARRLQEGGFVLTGLDRPDPTSKYHVRFFGRPAALPVLHVYLALKARVPVVVVAAIMQPNGIYRLHVSDPIEMRPYPDRHAEIVNNAERVMEVTADFIRQAPRQWAMFYPVWPEALDEVP